MALQTSGPISLADIQAEFGGSNPISLSEYYGADTGVPGSGAISFGNFYGKSAVTVFVYNATITASQGAINFKTLITNAGWNGTDPVDATLTINSGVIITSGSTGTPGFRTGSGFPAGSTLKLVNNGVIKGRGGRGGNVSGPTSFSAGISGGIALLAEYAITIDNNNQLAGGGGGGAASFAQIGQNPMTGQPILGAVGGGGGAVLGPGGTATTGNIYDNGNAGSATAGGGGGTATNQSTLQGGAGGAYGAGGGNSNNTGNQSGKGAGGKSVSGNSFITWQSTGTRNGAIT